jgi:hypothetical protein
VLPPAGLHLDTGATEDCNLSQIIEHPDRSMLDTPVRVARNGGAGQVRSNCVCSKPASALDRAVKFKKQRRAAAKYVLPQEWKLVCLYRACFRVCFDKEDIKFDIYQKARDSSLMELSCYKMLPKQKE